MEIIGGAKEAVDYGISEEDASRIYMSGQSLATAVIAFVVLFESVIATIVVCKNKKIKFSFKIIGLVTVGCLATIIFQIL